MKFHRNYLAAALTALAVLLLDRVSKLLIIQNFEPSQSYPVISNVFHITYIANTGSAFGLFKGYNFIFILISIIAIAFILYYSQSAKNKAEQILLGFLLGGVLGNIIDRLLYGNVIDFIDFRIWPVFNIADSFITIGVIGIVVYIWKQERAQES